jgi:predicted Fe-Mo cluster-binding NifX family protein
MRVAISTSGTTVDAPLEPRFGRAPRFLVCSTEQEGVEVVDNHPNLRAAQGAGIQAATLVSRMDVDAIVTGHCGPKAFRVLAAAGIKVFLSDAPTPADALDRLKAGTLAPAQAADVEGHWA